MMFLLQYTILACLVTAAYAFAPNNLGSNRHSTELFGGTGIAKSYTWKEDQFEIELRVKVPKATTARQIKYTPKSRSIHLVVGDEIFWVGLVAVLHNVNRCPLHVVYKRVEPVVPFAGHLWACLHPFGTLRVPANQNINQQHLLFP